ncbi:MAG: lanthionine synthetase LanC family protein [Pseudomonadota bacterium]
MTDEAVDNDSLAPDAGNVEFDAFESGIHARLEQLVGHRIGGVAVCGRPRKGDADIDQVLLDAGNLIWQAGPLAKGSNLCHGTGGNGYAFLKLFERTGDEQWLDRARAFAMHGISQYEAESARVGFDRFSLWTGDIGLAIYLHDCLRAEAAFPTVDVF